MLMTTTSNIEGAIITKYHGIIHSEVVMGINAFRDLGASVRNIIGGRSKGYEKAYAESRQDAIKELEDEARKIGANAIVGVRVDADSAMDGGAVMFTATGTAVTIEEN